MRAQRIVAVLTATLVGLAGAMALAPTPAHAGNWAVTVLDPVPDRLEPGRGYTLGLWVLQHGFHPYEGDLGRVSLRLVDAKGASVSFPAVALPEPAHYAAAVAVPHPGAWAVISVQGRFADYHVGTLTVPGRLSVLGVPVPLQPAQTNKYWPGAIRPPTVPVDTNRNPFAPVAAPHDSDTVAAAEPVSRTTAAPARSTPRLAVLVGLAVMAAAIAALVGYRRRPRRGGAQTTTAAYSAVTVPDGITHRTEPEVSNSPDP
jgi:hypothetical protein